MSVPIKWEEEALSKFFGSSSSVRVRRITLMLLDLALLYIAVKLAVFLRYEGRLGSYMAARLEMRLPLLIGIYTVCLILGGTYQMVWRFAGVREVFRVACTCLVATAVVLFLNRMFSWRMARSLFALIGLCECLLVLGSRFVWRALREAFQTYRAESAKNRILIVGAGEGGAYAARVCHEGSQKIGIPVAFVDDNPDKLGTRISAIPVLGTTEDIPDLVEKKDISEIIIAIPRIRGDRLNEIVSICKSTKCRVRILNNPGGLEEKKPAGQQVFREVNTTDFLSRDEVALDMDQIRGYLGGKVVLVTGGGGSIGS